MRTLLWWSWVPLWFIARQLWCPRCDDCGKRLNWSGEFAMGQHFRCWGESARRAMRELAS